MSRLLPRPRSVRSPILQIDLITTDEEVQTFTGPGAYERFFAASVLEQAAGRNAEVMVFWTNSRSTHVAVRADGPGADEAVATAVFSAVSLDDASAAGIAAGCEWPGLDAGYRPLYEWNRAGMPFERGITVESP